MCLCKWNFAGGFAVVALHLFEVILSLFVVILCLFDILWSPCSHCVFLFCKCVCYVFFDHFVSLCYCFGSVVVTSSFYSYSVSLNRYLCLIAVALHLFVSLFRPFCITFVMCMCL